MQPPVLRDHGVVLRLLRPEREGLMGDHKRRHILMPKAARFTKSYGSGFQVLFPDAALTSDLEELLRNMPTVRVEVNERSLLSFTPAFRGSAKSSTFYREASGYMVKGKHPDLEARLSHRSYADMPVDVRFYPEDAGVLQLAMPTQNQLDFAGSTEPTNKPYRRGA